MINRIIEVEIASTKKSVLLLGPRQTGKSTLMQKLKPDLEINLADELEFLNYSSRPETFRETIEQLSMYSKQNTHQSIYIDEIQRLPKLLNTIQTILDKNKNLKFLLTGSSARKLKHGEANLLPGRLINFNLGPLVARELNYEMNTKKCLAYGTLPEPYLLKSEKEINLILRSYAGNYLKEEIKAEALVRNLESFARFLNEVTLNMAEFIDFTKLAQKSKISRHAIPRYFEILEDTLIGYRIHHFTHAQLSQDLIKHPKFYFFDNGVYNGLLSNFQASSDRVGKLAEQLVFSQLMHSCWASDVPYKISTFRTRTGMEVDFIAEISNKFFAIEVKNSSQIDHSELEGLKFFDQALPVQKKLFIFHMGVGEKKYGNIWALPWQKGLQAIGL